MGPLDGIWHLGNFFLPPLALAALAAALAKLLWRRELAAVAWKRLAWPAALAGATVVLVGQMIDVTITEALPHSLRGMPLQRDRVSAGPARSPATTA